MSFRIIKLFVILILISFTASLSAQNYQRQNKLSELSSELKQRRVAMRGPTYERLKSISDGPMGALNRANDIELIGVDESGHGWYYQTDNLYAAQTVGADEVWPGGDTGFDITGTGTGFGELAVWDAGSVLASHQEFDGRVWNMDNANVHFHATHVAGTMVAAGEETAARGMSYEAEYLFSYDWNDDDGQMAEAADEFGLKISNHSYGWATGWRFNWEDDDEWYWYGNAEVSETEDYGFGFYSESAQSWDEIAYEAPYYTICKSAGNDREEGPGPGTGHYVQEGNDWVWSTTTRDRDGGPDGYDCVSWNGTAKNIITVGAVNDVPGGYEHPGDVSMSSFSCWGPTDDGRIKPDLVANGVDLYSTGYWADDAYLGMSGTSMSSPNLAGALNLLVQFYEEKHGGSAPYSASMKALLIHTANECGDHDGPDYKYGWGLMNVPGAAEIIDEDEIIDYRIQENILDDGAEFSIEYVSNGMQPIIATICWTDVPGEPVAPQVDPDDPMLVNDLDLRLEHIGTGTVYYPYILDPDNPEDAADNGDNILDNVEKIYIDAPLEGEYTLTVNHKGTLVNLEQAYSLVVTGMNWADDPRIPPYNLTADVDYEIGLTDLYWDFGPELNDFVEFKVYRNGEMIGTTEFNVFSDAMPEFGSYTYRVSAWYDEGESLPTNEVEINWVQPFAPNPVRYRYHHGTLGDITLSWQHMVGIEQSYDDGTNDNGLPFLISQPLGSLFALRMTSDVTGPLTEVGAWFTESDLHTFGHIKMVVFGAGQTEDTPGDTLFISEYVELTEEGWEWIGLAVGTVDLVAGEDYWVAVSNVEPGHSILGRDMDSELNERGYYSGNGVAWVRLPGNMDGNLMIRARSGQQQVTGENGLNGYDVHRDDELIATVTDNFLDDTLPEPGIYTYTVTAVYDQGSAVSDPFAVEWDGTGVEDHSIPATFMIGDVYPNPFNPEFKIDVTLGNRSDIRMRIFDVLGREVGQITRKNKTAGVHTLQWYAENHAAGVYFIQVEAGPVKALKKAVLLK